MKTHKTLKPLKNAHASNSKIGMGDYYGTGVRNKVGRMIDGAGMNPVKSSKLKKPPKSLA
jgi:hypothetical protein